MPKNSITELAQTIETMKLEIQSQREEINWMRLVLKQAGVDGPWVSPQVAAIATGRSRIRVMQDIEAAEAWRIKGRKWNLVYGVHYRNDQGINSEQPTWKVHLGEYYEFTKIPPDQLKAG